LAEAGWRFDAPQPTFLARSLAEHNAPGSPQVEEAVRVAEAAAHDRHDIFTDDALAWAYFKAGRPEDAALAMGRARRTGTRDRSILFHAAAIQNGLGNIQAARQLARESNDAAPEAPGPPARSAAMGWQEPTPGAWGWGPRH
jgi:hypothetical protein